MSGVGAADVIWLRAARAARAGARKCMVVEDIWGWWEVLAWLLVGRRGVGWRRTVREDERFVVGNGAWMLKFEEIVGCEVARLGAGIALSMDLWR